MIYDYIIIGSGPIGIETGIIAKQLNQNILILEKGKEVAFNTKKKSHLEMFSPWYYNYSPMGIKILKENNKFIKPKEDYESTSNYLKNYLIPLSEITNLNIKFNCEVIKIGKRQITKTDLIADNRKKYPFKVLINKKGKKKFFYAWNVLDASGIYDNPLYLGEGRVPAINELKYKKEIIYTAIDKKNKKRFDGKRVLVLGNTCCTAKTIKEFEKYLDNKETQLYYINEDGRKPYINQMKNDIFTKRVEIINFTNKLLESQNSQITILKKFYVTKIKKTDNEFIVFLDSFLNEKKTITVDTIISNYGFEPNNKIYKELQVHECYASLSPMNYATSMLEDTKDYAFTNEAQSFESMKNPEENFFILGAKSYGRNLGFSIYIGIGQIIELFSNTFGIAKDELLLKKEQIKEQRDITYCKKIEKDILSLKEEQLPDTIVANQKDKYKTITENLQEVIFQTDLKQKITYLSPSWERLSGFSTAEFIGLDWQSLLHIDSREAGLIKCNAYMSKELKEYNEEFKIKCKDGKVKWVNVNASILTDKNGIAYGTIGSILDITKIVYIREELEKKNRELDKLSITDELSSLYNRRYFDEMLQKEVDRAKRTEQNFSLIMCDIDYFKLYNDTYGHIKGDEIIKKISTSLKETFNRKIDTVARYGGEEFVVILPVSNSEYVLNLIKELCTKIEKLKIEHKSSLISKKCITLSYGVISGKINISLSYMDILELVDKELYKSKKDGRNTFSIKHLT